MVHLAWVAAVVVLLMVLVPVAFFPFSRLVFLAFDLVFRPPQADDYPDH